MLHMNLLFLSNWHCCVLVTTQSVADHCLHVLAICCHQRAACVVVVGPSANHREDQSYNIQSVEVKLLQMLQTIKSVHCSQCLIFSGGVCYSYSFFTPFPFFQPISILLICYMLMAFLKDSSQAYTKSFTQCSNIPAQMDMNYELVVWIPVSANKNTLHNPPYFFNKQKKVAHLLVIDRMQFKVRCSTFIS